MQVGVGESGHWYMRGKDTATEEINARELLPLMQERYGSSFRTAYQMIVERLREKGLSESFVSTFPFSAPVQFADQAESLFWIGLAKQWRAQIEESG